MWFPGCAFTPAPLLGSLYCGTNTSPSPWLHHSTLYEFGFFVFIPYVSRSTVLVFL